MKKFTKAFAMAVMCLVSLFAFTGCDWFINPKTFSQIGITIELDTSFLEYDWDETEDEWGTWGYYELSSTKYIFGASKDSIAWYEAEKEVENLREVAEMYFFSEGEDGHALTIEEYTDENTTFFYSIDDHVDKEGDRIVYLNVVMEGAGHYYEMYFGCFHKDYNQEKILGWAKTIRVV